MKKQKIKIWNLIPYEIREQIIKDNNNELKQERIKKIYRNGLIINSYISFYLNIKAINISWLFKL